MNFYNPETAAEALAILSKDSSWVIAGGTDLLVKNKDFSKTKGNIVDISNLKGLKHLSMIDEFMEIGATVTYSEILQSPIVQKHAPILADAAGQVGSVQIRNRGTIGGSIVTSSPAGDILTALYVLNAEIILTSKNRERIIPIKDFIVAPGKNLLQEAELVTKIRIKPMIENETWSFRKVGLRNALAISIVGVAIRSTARNGRFTQLQIALGSVAPTIKNMDYLASSLIGHKYTKKELWEKLTVVENTISPISDVRASKEYRLLTTKTVLLQCLSEMLGIL